MTLNLVETHSSLVADMTKAYLLILLFTFESGFAFNVAERKNERINNPVAKNNFINQYLHAKQSGSLWLGMQHIDVIIHSRLKSTLLEMRSIVPKKVG